MTDKEKKYVQKTIFMNMCMVCDSNGNVLALDKVGTGYSWTTFPGGHVELSESFTDAVIREIKEETGLTIHNPKLEGIYHWFRNDIHNIGYLYKANEFEGKLKSSEEGSVYWIPLEEYAQKELAQGMDKVLKIMQDDNFSECFFYEDKEIVQ